MVRMPTGGPKNLDSGLIGVLTEARKAEIDPGPRCALQISIRVEQVDGFLEQHGGGVDFADGESGVPAHGLDLGE